MPAVNELPLNVQHYVGRFVVRKRRLAAVKAAGAAGAFAAVWLLICCIADRLLGLPGWARLTLGIIGLGVVGTILFSPLLNLLRRRIDWTAAAEDIEQRSGHFAGRLETVTSQLLSRPEYRGSREILDHLAHQLEGEVDVAQAAKLVPWKPVVHPWLGAAAAVGVVGGLLFIPWLGMPQLILRLTMPLSAIAPVTTTRLHLITPAGGDAGVAQGRPLEITAEARHLGDSSMRLHISPDGKNWTLTPMAPAGDDNRYTATISSVDRDLRYFITGGDARTNVYDIQVLRKPGIAEFRIRYTYPAYTGRAPFVALNADGLVEALKGTEASISITATEPLKNASLTLNKQTLQMRPTADPRVRQATIQINRSEPYQIDLTSTRGVDAAGPPTLRIHAMPDRAPMARMIRPGEDLRLHPRDILPVQYEVLDDYGIGSMALEVQVNGAAIRRTPLPIHRDPRRQAGETALDLADYQVKIGDVVSFWVMASDLAGQKPGSVERRTVLVSPRSIDMKTHERIADLIAASALADTLVEQWTAAQKALHAPDAGPFAADQPVASASQTALLLRQQLLRAIVHSTSGDFSLTVAGLVDRAQIQTSMAEGLMRLFGGGGSISDLVQSRAKTALDHSEALRDQIKTLTAGERSAALLADRNNVDVLKKTAAEKTQSDSLLKENIERAEQEIAVRAREVGINPAASDFENSLKSRVEAAESMVKAATPVDFTHDAATWAAMFENSRPDWHIDLDSRLGAAAQAEAVRSDGDLVRSRDLQLAAAAAVNIRARVQNAQAIGAATQPLDAEALKEYPSELGALQKEHELSRRPNDVRPPAQVKAIHAAAAEARVKMARWAGQTDLLANSTETQPSMENLAMQAGADAQRGDFDRAGAMDEAMAARENRPNSATRPSRSNTASNDAMLPEDAISMMSDARKQAQQARIAKEMAEARTLDGLAQRQRELADKTEGAPPDKADNLATRQRDIAGSIADFERRQKAEKGNLARDPDSREAMMEAIRKAQEQLAALPHQLAIVQSAAAAQREAYNRSQAADRALEATPSTPADRRAAAARTARQAGRDLSDAANRLDELQQPVLPETAAALSSVLEQFSPEMDDAATAVNQLLAPALRTVNEGIMHQSADVVARGVDSARQAIKRAQLGLRDAQEKIAEQDPVLAAKWYALEAADALKRQPPDMEMAVQNQRDASASLSKAMSRSLHNAAAGRFAITPGMGRLYGLSRLSGPGTGEGNAVAGHLANLSQWGRLQRHDPTELKTGARDADMPEYQEALKAYFSALGRTEHEPSKK